MDPQVPLDDHSDDVKKMQVDIGKAMEEAFERCKNEMGKPQMIYYPLQVTPEMLEASRMTEDALYKDFPIQILWIEPEEDTCKPTFSDTHSKA